MTGKLNFPLQGSSLNVVKKCGVPLDNILNIKFGCVASFDGVDFEKDTSFTWQRKPATIAPEKRLEFNLQTGVKVSVWKADLTNFHADAVVNAANDRLQHYGGLAQALSIAGGPQIQKESDDHIKKHKKIRTGDAVALGPGLLPCTKIIHAVGPELPINPSRREIKEAKAQLQTAIKSILKIVDELKLANVAIPAISSGLFHYPLPECADTIVSTVKEYYDKTYGQIHLPKDIFLVNHDEPTVREIKRACHQMLGSHPSLINSQPVRNQPTTFSQAAASNSKGAASNTSFSVNVGQVCLTLKQGHIEGQMTDVIVNTASQNLDLNIGQISKAILLKAGYEIQREISKAVKKSNIICTKPYKLKCKEVYHTFCPDRADAAAQQILYTSVLDCLWTAAASPHKSIAFPAIGTGALGFRREESACIMLSAVADFASKCLKPLDVFFVIFPSDYETFQVFRGQMNIFQQGTSQHNFAPETGKDNHSRAPNPQICLRGPTEESIREAEKWLSDLLSMRSRTVNIYNNFIQHFSEQDHLQLSRLTKAGVTIEEFFTQGHACITVQGDSEEDAAIAALKVEAMLCKIQKDFLLEEKQEIQLLSTKKVSIEIQPDDFSSSKFSERKRTFSDQKLWVVKVEKVENPALNELFELKKQQLRCSTSVRMYQRVPAQFCEMIHNIGFHTEFAPPEDPAYGEGIYFADSVKAAMKLWKENNEAFLYFVEAEVLTGKSVPGKPGLILPPPVAQDPSVIYDSLSGSNISVIFSGYQALPKYIFTCKKK